MSIEYSEIELKKYNEEYIKKYIEPERLEEGLKRLEQGEPVQYIVGDVNFYGYTFKVDKRVLIPRFETEELVEKTLKYIKGNFNANLNIVDLGTGSGCIAITLKKELPDSFISAVDVSEDALEVAKENANLNKVDINFIHSNMLDNVKDIYDVIISNPPYIAYGEEIMDIVKEHEPHQALYADNEGLYFYDQILKTCRDKLKDKYLIAFEIGQNQGKEICSLAYKYLQNIEVSIEKDMRGLERFVFIRGGVWK